MRWAWAAAALVGILLVVTHAHASLEKFEVGQFIKWKGSNPGVGQIGQVVENPDGSFFYVVTTGVAPLNVDPHLVYAVSWNPLVFQTL